MSTMITLKFDGTVLSAEVPLGLTLKQFLEHVGKPMAEGAPLSDGRRSLLAELELAHRFQGAALSSDVPEAMMRQVCALAVDDLQVLSGRDTA